MNFCVFLMARQCRVGYATGFVLTGKWCRAVLGFCWNNMVGHVPVGCCSRVSEQDPFLCQSTFLLHIVVYKWQGV